MSVEIKVPKKLIEVAIPLDAINDACAYEKLPGIGAHPRGIHLWWARRPLAAARAIIFAKSSAVVVRTGDSARNVIAEPTFPDKTRP